MTTILVETRFDSGPEANLNFIEFQFDRLDRVMDHKRVVLIVLANLRS